jgi:hypothetical protein
MNKCVYKKDNGKWSFYNENNKPFNFEYATLEDAINAMIQYFNSIEKIECSI